jgi:hypothetical protein
MRICRNSNSPVFEFTIPDGTKCRKPCLIKLTRFFTFLIFLHLMNIQVHGQDANLLQEISISDTLCPVETALKLIEHTTGLSFSYNTGLINKRKMILFSAKNEELISVLRRVIDEPSLDYRIIGKHIVVYKPKKISLINPENSLDSVFFFEIRGRVLDKRDNQPIPFSSVYLANKSTGTISNTDGYFVLKLSSNHFHDTLNISSIGYISYKAPVSVLINTNRDYLLKEDIISIQEVIIRKLDPISIMQSALDNIYANYPQKPAVLTSFYRESVKRGNHYLIVSEAIIENYKSGYENFSTSDQIKILKGRKSEDVRQPDSIMLRLKAGLNSMILLDVVKNMPDFMNVQNLASYDYKMTDIVVDNGKDYYTIEFKPTKGSVNTYYSGRMLIGVKDLAFKWVEFYIDPEKLKSATRLFIVRKPPYLKVKVLDANYKIAFSKVGTKYYLQLIQCETSFRIRNQQELSGSVYHTTLEMAVTDIDTLNVERFRLKETAHINEYFAEQIGEYDESFWGEYNFITPDESLENALIKLSRIQAARKKKE